MMNTSAPPMLAVSCVPHTSADNIRLLLFVTFEIRRDSGHSANRNKVVFTSTTCDVNVTLPPDFDPFLRVTMASLVTTPTP